MQEKISCSSFAPGLNKIEKSIEKSIGKIFMLKLEYWNRLPGTGTGTNRY